MYNVNISVKSLDGFSFSIGELPLDALVDEQPEDKPSSVVVDPRVMIGTATGSRVVNLFDVIQKLGYCCIDEEAFGYAAALVLEDYDEEMKAQAIV